jgi:integrase
MGIRRRHKVAQRQAKPLLRKDLLEILDTIGTSNRDVRDKALLLIGFAGAFRRSELVGINVEDLEWRPDGVIVGLRSSKTDQVGEGRKVGIPMGSPGTCPVTALKSWLTSSSIQQGPVFRAINRHGHMNFRRLSGEAVSLILKKRVWALSLDETHYSGHSLRAGLATSAAAAGIPIFSIRQLTGHTQDKTLALYIRNSRELSDSPIRGLL